MRALRGMLAGVVVSIVLVMIIGRCRTSPDAKHTLVPEDASGALQRIAIHYVPSMDQRVLPVWKQLFAVLPESVEVAVVVEHEGDFDRFLSKVGASPRFTPVVLGHSLTTWSRDRLAAIDNNAVLAPPRVSVGGGPRAGDWEAPFAIARELYGAKPAISDLVFEGGDLAASQTHVFADANLITRNLGRRTADPAHLEASLKRTFDQDVVFLGAAPGDIPEHHIMMYMVPLDERSVLVGDVRLGKQLAPEAVADPAFELHAARFDRVASQLVDRGFTVTRIPVIVLPGAGSYVTYTNAVFDRDEHGKVVYLPTYRMPVLDAAAAAQYQQLGYRVVPIDVSTMYTMNGSLGCLVNVLARD